MALMERVATLVRANLNDLIDKAEEPEKMIKQLILDMQNQLMQVKTQVAIAIADQHVLIKGFAEQVGDQTVQVENLKTALRKLDLKLNEARSKSDVLIAQHRRARALTRASDARIQMGDTSKAAAFDRVKNSVQHSEAVSHAKAEMAVDNIDDRLAALEKEDAVDKLLAEMKARKGLA